MMTGRILNPAIVAVPTARPCAFLIHVVAVSAVWLAVVASCGPRSLRAAEVKDNDRAAPSIVYRRIFVPAENIAAWPRDGEKYLPIEARDFDAWVAAANRAASDGDLPAIISEAE